MESTSKYRSKFYATMIANSRAAVYQNPDICELICDIYEAASEVISTQSVRKAIALLRVQLVKLGWKTKSIRDLTSNVIHNVPTVITTGMMMTAGYVVYRVGSEAYRRSKKNIVVFDAKTEIFHYIFQFTLGMEKKDLLPTIRKHARVWLVQHNDIIKTKISVREKRIEALERMNDDVDADMTTVVRRNAKIQVLEDEIAEYNRNIIADDVFIKLCEQVFPKLLNKTDADELIMNAQLPLPKKLYKALIKNERVYMTKHEIGQIKTMLNIGGCLGVLGFGGYCIGKEWCKTMWNYLAGDYWLIYPRPVDAWLFKY